MQWDLHRRTTSGSHQHLRSVVCMLGSLHTFCRSPCEPEVRTCLGRHPANRAFIIDDHVLQFTMEGVMAESTPDAGCTDCSLSCKMAPKQAYQALWEDPATERLRATVTLTKGKNAGTLLHSTPVRSVSKPVRLTSCMRDMVDGTRTRFQMSQYHDTCNNYTQMNSEVFVKMELKDKLAFMKKQNKTTTTNQKEIRTRFFHFPPPSETPGWADPRGRFLLHSRATPGAPGPREGLDN